MKRSYIREILDCIDDDTISFAGGLPNEKLFDLNGIAKVTQEVLKDAKALQYSSSQGLLGLRETIAQLYTTQFHMPTSADEIMITTGSQQAFDIILKVFSKDEMVVQNPSYIGALNAFKSIGLGLKSFNSVGSLKTTLNNSNGLYVMSDFCNPTGLSLSNKNRKEMAQILEHKKSLLIEDGAYSMLSFDGTIQQPICALYDQGFHLGSFSKILAPGLRVGWIRSSKSNIQKIMAAKESMDLHTPTLNQMIIEAYLKTYDIEKQLERVRQDYQKRMQFMSRCMSKYLEGFEFLQPKGGMFIYGTFKHLDTMKLAQKALESKVAFVPAQVFDAQERVSYNARFNFTNSSYKQMVKGIKILRDIVKAQKDETLQGSIWFNIFNHMNHKASQNHSV